MRKCVIWLDGQLFAQTKEEAWGDHKACKAQKSSSGEMALEVHKRVGFSTEKSHPKQIWEGGRRLDLKGTW